MARRAVRSGRAGLAFELALAAIQADPDYEPARRLFGYQKFRDQWRTLYEVKKLRAGFVWSDKFGWLPKAYLRRYEEGQRYCDGRWISADEDARAASRHPLRLGRRDRALHDPHQPQHRGRRGAGREARTALSPLAADSSSATTPRRPTWWRCSTAARKPPSAPAAGTTWSTSATATTTTARCGRRCPTSSISIGVYLDQTRRAYFFAGKDSDDRTLYHEATHQLFHESRPVAPDVGRKANFWIVEGIAMYMESLRQEDGYYVLGGFDDERMHAARYRLLHDKFYVPLDEFTGYGMEKLQNDPRIATLYSQAAGLTQLPGLLRRRPLPRRAGGVSGGRLHRPRRARHAWPS